MHPVQEGEEIRPRPSNADHGRGLSQSLSLTVDGEDVIHRGTDHSDLKDGGRSLLLAPRAAPAFPEAGLDPLERPSMAEVGILWARSSDDHRPESSHADGNSDAGVLLRRLPAVPPERVPQPCA